MLKLVFLLLEITLASEIRFNPNHHSLSAQNQLIVVHPTHYFDQPGEAKEGVNFVVDTFLNRGQTVYTLVETDQMISEIYDPKYKSSKQYTTSDSVSENYTDYLKRIRETKLIQSENGESDLLFSNTSWTIVGGYLQACLKIALKHLIKNNLREGIPITIHLPLYALYGKRSFAITRGNLEANIRQALANRNYKTIKVSFYENDRFLFSAGEGTKEVHMRFEHNDRNMRYKVRSIDSVSSGFN
jgi:hypothetical protein